MTIPITLTAIRASKTDNTGKITSYTYDGLGRLTSESPTGEAAVSYTYDDYNNRAVMTVSGGAITTYGYDKNNRLQSEVKTVDGTTEITYYSYDDNGNQIYKSTGTLKPVNATDVESIGISVSGESADTSSVTISRYDGFNQLIKTTVGDKTVTYEYNADGLRVTKTVNGAVTQHVWDGDQIALELDGSGNVTNKYVRGINLIYADASGAVKYYLFNAHGDAVQLTGTDGNATKSYDYDAFGNEKNPDATDTNVFRYCGEYFDKETGTIYLRARYYDPEIGRFISEDSVWGKDSDPLSLNLYTYCEDDPVNFYDATGHEKATFGEKWFAFWHAGPFDSLTINKFAKSSLLAAQNYALKHKLYYSDGKTLNLTDNEADAFRHFTWNYDSVKAGVPVEDVAQVITNHEVVQQDYFGKDKDGSKYYSVTGASLMDIFNNKVGRYQATLAKNKNKTALQVFSSMVGKGSFITSLSQVPSSYDFDKKWVIPAYYDADGNYYEASVIIKGGISEDPNKIVVVNKEIANASGFKIH